MYRREGENDKFLSSFNAVFRVYIYIGEARKGNELFKQLNPYKRAHTQKTKKKNQQRKIIFLSILEEKKFFFT